MPDQHQAFDDWDEYVADTIRSQISTSDYRLYGVTGTDPIPEDTDATEIVSLIDDEVLSTNPPNLGPLTELTLTGPYTAWGFSLDMFLLTNTSGTNKTLRGIVLLDYNTGRPMWQVKFGETVLMPPGQIIMFNLILYFDTATRIT